MESFWERAIVLVDMNAFFASLEQLDFPELRGQPVAVTNGEQGTCVITASYEARKFGIKTGVRLPLAKQLCPHLKVCPSRPQRYAEVSARIMASLDEITPDVEVFSVDEAFLDITKSQALFGSPEVIAKKIKNLVQEVSGVTCSVGVSGDKTTAKFAAKLQKPDGLTVIHPDEAEVVLSSVPVTSLCGIATGVGRFLEQYGVVFCGDMKKLPISILAKRFGNVGRRIWLMCQGKDPDVVFSKQRDIKSLGHGKVMPPNTRDFNVIKTYLLHMSEKVALRLRTHEFEAQTFFIGVRQQQSRRWLGDKLKLAYPTQDGAFIYQLGLHYLSAYWSGEGVCQIQVTALDPKKKGVQYDLFNQSSEAEAAQSAAVNALVDAVNNRFGSYALTKANLLNRSGMHDVIAPAWRPTGSRRSI